MKIQYCIKLVSIWGAFATLGTLGLNLGCSSTPVDLSEETPEYRAEHEAQVKNGQAEIEKEALKMRAIQVERALANRDVVMGMRMDDVRNVWGDPAEIEAAGMGFGNNQRWLYYMGLSSKWSIDPVRVVYFENGEVVGWDTLER